MKFNFKRGSATKPGEIHKRVLLSPDHTLYPYFYEQTGKPLKPEKIKQKFINAPEEVKQMAKERGLLLEKKKK